MAGETVITSIGNLTADPSCAPSAAVLPWRASPSPRPRARSTGSPDSGRTGRRSSCAARPGVNSPTTVPSRLTKGMRVIAQGRLQQRSYQANDGTNRTVVEIAGRRDRPVAALRHRPGHPSELRASRVAIVADSAEVTTADSRTTVGIRAVPGTPAEPPTRAVGTRGAPLRRPWPHSPVRPSIRGAMPVPAPPSRHSGPRPISVATPRNPSSKPYLSNTHHCAESVVRRTSQCHARGRSRGQAVQEEAEPAEGCQGYRDRLQGRCAAAQVISDRGKIRSRRITGVTVQEQREISKAIKNAREMALLPYATSGR